MPEQTPPPTVTPPANTPPPTTPVTTQTVPTPKPNTGEPTLETLQTAETVSALGALFDEAIPPVKPIAPVTTSPAETVPGQTTPPPVEPPKGTPIGTDDFQKKIDAFKPPPGAHPNVTAGFDQLKKEATDQYSKATQLETQLKEAQTKLTEFEQKGNKLPENVEKELQGLRERVREIDFKSDPEFQKNYVQPVQQAEKDIIGLLRQAGLKDEAIKQIEQNGGIIAMSQSADKAGVKDNPDMTMAQWVEDFLLAKTPSVFKNRILAKLSTAGDLIEKGQHEITDFRANAQQRIEARMKKMNAEFEEGQRATIESLGEIAKPKTIPPTATAEERQAIEAHNGLLKQADEKFKSYIGSTQTRDPKVAAEILVKATQADVLMSVHQADQKTITALRTELAAIKGAGSHSRAGNHAPPPSQTTQPDQSGLLKQSTESALNGLFNQTGPTP